MTNAEDVQTARLLAAQAMGPIGRASGREPWREVLRWVTRGRLGVRHGWPVVPDLGMPWQDTFSAERVGWRCRKAKVNGEDFAFAVDYRICAPCGIGWVEQPYTLPKYERCGLASAALAALRSEYPGLSWHTLGGHFRSSRPFWEAVGRNILGSYKQRPLCTHLDRPARQ